MFVLRLSESKAHIDCVRTCRSGWGEEKDKDRETGRPSHATTAKVIPESAPGHFPGMAGRSQGL